MCRHVISRSSVSCNTQQPAEQLEPVWNSPATGGWWRTHTRIKRRKTSAQQLFTALHKLGKTVGIWDRKEVTRMKRCTLFCFSCFSRFSRLFVEAVWFYLSCLVKQSNSGCFYGCTRPSNSGFKMLCLILNTFIQNSAIFGDIFGIFTDFRISTRI